MANETEIRRGTSSKAEQVGKRAKARLEAMLQEPREESTETPWWASGDAWEIYAMGPEQNYNFTSGSPQPPGRIVFLGETAYVTTVLWLNPNMAAHLAGMGACVNLSYHTANTQTMTPVPAMDYTCSIDAATPTYADPDYGSFYITVWEFTPTETGCLFETNICGTVCNCKGNVAPGYAGFVRWVYDFDYDVFFGSQWSEFNNPIRYLVADKDATCNSDNACVVIQ